LNDVRSKELINLVFVGDFISARHHDYELTEETTDDTLDVLLLMITVDVHHFEANKVFLMFSLLDETGIEFFLQGTEASLLFQELT